LIQIHNSLKKIMCLFERVDEEEWKEEYEEMREYFICDGG
jgi:hypothetical protein